MITFFFFDFSSRPEKRDATSRDFRHFPRRPTPTRLPFPRYCSVYKVSFNLEPWVFSNKTRTRTRTHTHKKKTKTYFRIVVLVFCDSGNSGFLNV